MSNKELIQVVKNHAVATPGFATNKSNGGLDDQPRRPATISLLAGACCQVHT